MQQNYVKFDMIDKKILSELDLNSRQPLSKIAKKVRCSRTIVEYRIKKLKEHKIIQALSAFIDPAKFGFTSWKVYLKLHNKEKETQEKIIAHLQKNKNVWWIINCEGNFDLMFCILTKTVHEFHATLQNFQTQFSKVQQRIEITTHINPDFFSRGYLLGAESKKTGQTALKEPTMEKIDSIDLFILKKLVKNSRIPSTEIALSLNTTPRIINYRIQELIKKQIITHFRLILDINEIGMDYYKVMLNLKELTKERENTLKKFIELHPNIINYSNSWGPWEIEFEVEVSNFKALIRIINEFRQNFADIIKNTEFVLIYKELKSTNDFLKCLET